MLPRIVAEESINQPLVMPNTNPPVVTQVLYPIMGGKETKNVASQRMSQPPGALRQRLATGARYWKMEWLYVMARMARTVKKMEKKIAPARWRGERCVHME